MQSGNSALIPPNLPLNDTKLLSVITGKQVNKNFHKARTRYKFQWVTNPFAFNVILLFLCVLNSVTSAPSLVCELKTCKFFYLFFFEYVEGPCGKYSRVLFQLMLKEFHFNLQTLFLF